MPTPEANRSPDVHDVLLETPTLELTEEEKQIQENIKHKILIQFNRDFINKMVQETDAIEKISIKMELKTKMEFIISEAKIDKLSLSDLYKIFDEAGFNLNDLAETAGINLENEMIEISVETKEKFQRKLEEIITGNYFISREIAKGNIKREKEKTPPSEDIQKQRVREDLQIFLGVEEIKFNNQNKIEKFGVSKKVERLEMESKRNIKDKFLDSLKRYGQYLKNPKLIIGDVLGGKRKWVVGAVGVVGGTAMALNPVTLFLAPFVFGTGLGAMAKGAVEFVKNLNVHKQKSLRVEAEKHDWEKYQEIWNLAQKIEKKEINYFLGVSELAKKIKDLEEKSFEKQEDWKKEERRWTKLGIGAGLATGVTTAVGSILYSKLATLKDLMAQGTSFDFDSNEIYHTVHQTKNGFVFDYNDAAEATAAQQTYQQLADDGAQNIGQGVLNEYGQHGAHMLAEQSSVAQAFAQKVFNPSYYKDMASFLAGTTTSAVWQFAEFWGLKKNKKEYESFVKEWEELGEKMEEEKQLVETKKTDARRAKEEIEGKKKTEEERRKLEPFYQAKKGEQYIFKHSGKFYRFEVDYFEDLNSNDPKVILKNIDKCPDFKDDEGKTKNEIMRNRNEFRESRKWDHKNYSYDEWQTYKMHKDIVDKILPQMEIPFISKEAMKRVGLDPSKNYAVLSIKIDNNEIVLVDTKKPRTPKNRIQKKISEIATIIKIHFKKAVFVDSGDDSTNIDSTEKPAEETLIYQKGVKVEFIAKDKDGDFVKYTGEVDDYKSVTKKYTIKLIDASGKEHYKDILEQFVKKI